MDPYLRIASIETEHEKLCTAYAQMTVELQSARQQLAQARKQAFLDAARIGQEIHDKWWALFKRWHGPERGNSYFEGQADGALDVAEALLREAEKL